MFTIYLFGQSNPKLYSMLGNQLFDAGNKFESLKYDENITIKIHAYRVKMLSVYKQGLYLDSKATISSKEKKEYLSSLL
jgi:hypothetical protein